MNRYPIAATVNLDLLIESGGTGTTGQSPTVVIQRLTDDYYYDDGEPTGSRFLAAYATNAMTEVDSTNLPGLYRYQFDHSEDATASEYFYVRYINTGLLQDETIAFGPLRTAASLSTCNLYGTILDVNGDPDVNKPIRVSILPNTILSAGAQEGISVDKIETYSDATGAFGIDIVRGLVVRLQIPSLGYDRKVTIPSQSSVNFADL